MFYSIHFRISVFIGNYSICGIRSRARSHLLTFLGVNVFGSVTVNVEVVPTCTLLSLTVES